MTPRIIFIIRITLFFSISLLLLGCPEAFNQNSSPNTITWTGAWENDTELFGTFTLNMTFEGENMLYNGGNGTISGSVTWKGINGQDLVADTIIGTWRNGLSSNHDLLEYSISSTDGHLTIIDYIHYETAAEITNGIFTIGAFSLDSSNGSWHTSPSSYNADNATVSSAVLINQGGQFIDIEYINGNLYAVLLDNSVYSVVSIDIANGTFSTETTNCAEPYAITYDGTYTWIVGKETAGAADPSLFKYSGVIFNVNESGYPKLHSDLSSANAISYSGTTLYYHNGAILTSAIGSIDTSTGETTPLLYDSFGSLPDLARTTKIAAGSGAYYTAYFAAGDDWCQLRKLNTDGGLINAYYCPVNMTGPIAVDGGTLYIIQGDPNRLYVVQL